MVMFGRDFFTNIPLSEVEHQLLSDFNNEADVWPLFRQECTIDELVEELRCACAIGYMMDDGVWYRCSVIEDGFALWEEIEIL